MQQDRDFRDPFDAGQMVGILIMLSYIEKNNGIPKDMLEQIKRVSAENLQVYFEKPTEDVHLIIEDLVKDIKTT